MEILNADKQGHTKIEILEDLEYWRKKKEHFERTNNKEGVKISKLLIDKYLDAYNDVGL
jgi:hypothetical protein